jgi:hypothetical protein
MRTASAMPAYLALSAFFFMTWNLQAELGKPNILQPNKGRVSIFGDCSPIAEPTFEVGDLFLSLDQNGKITNNLIHLFSDV